VNKCCLAKNPNAMKNLNLIFFALTLCFAVSAKEYHVAKTGNDNNKGILESPFLTIQAAANIAQPGDVIIVHEGTYRERINPPRGGISDTKRIIYLAATGEKVAIKGSEVVNGWKEVEHGVWTVTLPNSFFGEFNPFQDAIYGDEWDNKAESAYGYNQTIERALKNGWSKENIGSHIVRNNNILHCGQAGIVGSMGAAFSTITGNEIHDIYLDWPFYGAEMAGIKFHAPIDSEISNNHIYRCGHNGMWLDWMTQGTRVTRNLMHDNTKDIFVEVNHGPFLVDNNLFLSTYGILESCGGGAYVHNLFAGEIKLRDELHRETPYHKPHSTEVLGLSKVVGDDERFYNNLFAGNKGLSVYKKEAVNLHAAGNVYTDSAKPSVQEQDALVLEDINPAIKLEEKSDGWWLEMTVGPERFSAQKRNIITTETLGKTIISKAFYENPDGTPYRIETDYFGEKRTSKNPEPGPLQFQNGKEVRFKVWPGK